MQPKPEFKNGRQILPQATVEGLEKPKLKFCCNSQLVWVWCW